MAKVRKTVVVVYRHFDHFTFDVVLFAGTASRVKKYMNKELDPAYASLMVIADGVNPDQQEDFRQWEVPHIVLMYF